MTTPSHFAREEYNLRSKRRQQYEIIKIQGIVLKINKLHTGLFTTKTIQQLQAEPKVILPVCKNKLLKNSVRNNSSKHYDRDVPDISDIGNEIECSTCEDLDSDNERKFSTDLSEIEESNDISLGDVCELSNIEGELYKMFNEVNQVESKKFEVKRNQSSRHEQFCKRKRKHTKNIEDTKTLLLRLFGEDCDDDDELFVKFRKIETSPSDNTPKKIESRRNSLLVSIPISKEDLQPLKKRQSVCREETSRVVPPIQPQVVEIELKTVSNLTTDFVGESVEVSVVSNPLQSAIVMKPNVQSEIENVKVRKDIDVIIDLTRGEDSFHPKENWNAVKKENEDLSCQSETKVDVGKQVESEKVGGIQSQSNTSQRPPPASDDQPSSLRHPILSELMQFTSQQQHNPSPIVIEQVAPLSFRLRMGKEPSPPRTTTGSLNQVSKNTITQSSLSSYNSQGQIQKQHSLSLSSFLNQLPKNVVTQSGPYTYNYQPVTSSLNQAAKVTVTQSNSSCSYSLQSQIHKIPSLPTVATSANQMPTQSRILQTQLSCPQMLLGASQQPSTLMSGQRQNWTYQRPVLTNTYSQPQINKAVVPPPPPLPPPPYRPNLNLNQTHSNIHTVEHTAPQLIRLYRRQPMGEYHLISNTLCGEKIFRHLFVFIRWKHSVYKFSEEARSFFSPQEFQEDGAVFSLYTTVTMAKFGKRLITELSAFDVELFNMGEIFDAIGKKLREKSVLDNIYRTCANIFLMIKGCESECCTPFTKKFFAAIKLCIERMENKMRKVSLFTSDQLKLLEHQIVQYLKIQDWLRNFTKRNISENNDKRNNSTQELRRLARKRKQSNDSPIVEKQNTLNSYVQQPCPSDRSANKDNSNLSPQSEVAVNKDNRQLTTNEKSSAQLTGTAINKIIITPLVPLTNQNHDPNKTLPSNQSFEIEVLPNVPLNQDQTHQVSVITFSPSAKDQQLEKKPMEIAFSQSAKDKQEKKPSEKANAEELEVIDLTWIDDGDENQIFEEVTEFKSFPFKMENPTESETTTREAISPADSGLGSPRAQADDGLKCFCGKDAVYVCACNCSMYCSRECQIEDWSYHQKLCEEMKP